MSKQTAAWIKTKEGLPAPINRKARRQFKKQTGDLMPAVLKPKTGKWKAPT